MEIDIPIGPTWFVHRKDVRESDEICAQGHVILICSYLMDGKGDKVASGVKAGDTLSIIPYTLPYSEYVFVPILGYFPQADGSVLIETDSLINGWPRCK